MDFLIFIVPFSSIWMV